MRSWWGDGDRADSAQQESERIDETFYDWKTYNRLTMHLTDEDCYATPFFDPTPVDIGHNDATYARETAMVRKVRDLFWPRGRHKVRRRVNQGKPRPYA